MQLVSICDVRIIFQEQYILSNFKFQHSVGVLILHFTPLPTPLFLVILFDLDTPTSSREYIFAVREKQKRAIS